MQIPIRAITICIQTSGLRPYHKIPRKFAHMASLNIPKSSRKLSLSLESSPKARALALTPESAGGTAIEAAPASHERALAAEAVDHAKVVVHLPPRVCLRPRHIHVVDIYIPHVQQH